jgi:hypothetical protein
MRMTSMGCVSRAEHAGIQGVRARRAEAEAVWLQRLYQWPANARSLEPAPGVGTAATRQRRIEEAAYFRALRRGFVPGFEVSDWLEAEAEVDAMDRGRG